jgi:hypothetical protein
MFFSLCQRLFCMFVFLKAVYVFFSLSATFLYVFFLESGVCFFLFVSLFVDFFSMFFS